MVKKKQIKVTLIRSLIGRQARHRACVKGLGLSRINSSVVVDDTPAMRGMVNKVSHLLSVEEV